MTPWRQFHQHLCPCRLLPQGLRLRQQEQPPDERPGDPAPVQGGGAQQPVSPRSPASGHGERDLPQVTTPPLHHPLVTKGVRFSSEHQWISCRHTNAQNWVL